MGFDYSAFRMNENKLKVYIMKNKSKGERKGWTPLSEADLKIDLTYLKGKKKELKHISGNSSRLIIK